MLSQQIKNELPAELILTIMQYACYKTHDTAKMIKQAVEDKHELKHYPHCTGAWNCFGLIRVSTATTTEYFRYENEEEAIDYIEVDIANIVRDINFHEQLEKQEVSVLEWFEVLTDRYADCSDEFRDNLIILCQMIVETRPDILAMLPLYISHLGMGRERAWKIYKMISDCPTSVY